jgi:transcriptional regulator with XRE-family HTH domain
LSARSRTDDPEYTRLLAQEELIVDATELICDLLAKQGLTRQDLAERLGKSKGFVSQILSGERNMTLRTLADFASALEHRLHLEATPVESVRRPAERWWERAAATPPRAHHWRDVWESAPRRVGKISPARALIGASRKEEDEAPWQEARELTRRR